MKVRDNKGSITIFVLVGLLFMSAFLLISYAYNVNKSKVAQEQFNMISQIYSPNKSDEESYTDAYTDLRNKNKQTLTSSSENSNELELTKTFEGNIQNYKIYGNSVQDGTPGPTNPVEIQNLGDIANFLDINAIKSSNFTINDSNVSVKVIASNSSSSTGLTLKELCPELIVGNTYTISYTADYKDSHISIGSFATGIWESGTTKIITEDDLNAIVRMGSSSGISNSRTVTFSKIQVESGSSVTEYVPYGKYKIPIMLSNQSGESIETNIYLNEPLRKVGNYADYIDFKTGKVVRNVSSFIFGNNLSFNSTKEDRILISNVRNKILKTSNAGMSMIWKYEYPQKNRNTAFLYTGNGYFYWYPDVTVFGVNFGDDNATIKDPKLQEWLAKQSDEIKTVYYVLATPDDSESISLPELKTYEDYTKIEVLTDVAPSKIEATYEGYTLE